MNYTKTVTVAAITLALLIPVGLQSKEAARLKREVATISRQISGLGQHRSNKHEPAMPLTAMILPKNSAKGIAKVDADEVEPNPPSPLTVVAQAFGNLKREEIFYQRKYADAVPKPNDPEYAEYVADMDAFMRQLGKDMVAIAAHETDLDLEPASVKAEFFADVLSQAIKLDDATATKARTILSEKFGEHSDLIESSDSRPKDPKLLPEWEEQNELVLGSAWDEIHELLSPEEQKNLEFGFPRRSIVGRSIGIGFPGGKGF